VHKASDSGGVPTAQTGAPLRQMLPSEFVPRVRPTPDTVRERAALHRMLTDIMPRVLREAVANNSRLIKIQMPEVISAKDHQGACTLAFEMLQSPELVQMIVLSAFEHTLGACFEEEGIGEMFESALWSRATRHLPRM
jgi:hypothetical protein